MKHLIIAMSLALFANITTAGTVRNDTGKAFSAIVVPGQCAGSVRYAAQELAKYLEKSCGAKLPVVIEGTPVTTPAIYLGETNFAQRNKVDFNRFVPDEFVMKNTPEGLIIGGKDYNGPPITGFLHPFTIAQMYSPKLDVGMFGGQGTLFGVYRFLENYAGIRWYMPNEIGEVIPPHETINVDDVNQRIAPAFEYRYIYLCDDMNAYPDDMAFVKHLGLGGRAPVQINHSYWFFAKHQKDHPEYFALVDGKRDFTNLCASIAEGTPCLSNDAFIRQATKDIGEYFDKNPNVTIFPLAPGDGLTRICECPKCQAMLDKKAPESGKFSEYIWTFTNRVATELRKTHPDKKIGCFAYEHYFDPPQRIGKLSDNLVIMICKSRLMFSNPAYKENVRRSIEKWTHKVKTIYFWEYYLHTGSPWRNFPVFFPDLIQDDIKYLKAINAGGEFIEAEAWYGSESTPRRMALPGTQHLNFYITAKLYWNPNLDVNALLNEYYALFYGPAAVPMKKFWELSRHLWVEKGKKNFKESGGEIVSRALADSVFSTEDMKELISYISAAYKAVPADSVYARRIKLVGDELMQANKVYEKAKQIKAPEIVIEKSTVIKQYTAKPQRLIGKDGDAIKNQAWLSWGYDDKNLYVKVIAIEPEMKKLVAECKKTDDGKAWADDCIEIFIAPDVNNRSTGYQLIFSVSGAIFDGQYSNSVPQANVSWNAGASSKIKKLADRYVMEITIPFAGLGIKPQTGEKFAFNLFRIRRAGEVEYSCWSAPFEYLHCTPNRFGIITLK